jgi:polysaccharide biosynthesis transport protein
VSNQLMSYAKNEMLVPSTVGSAQHPSVNTNALQNFMRVLTKRRKWIIGSIVICELLAILLTLIMKPTYGATATIELNKNSAGSLELGLGDDALSQQLTSGADTLQTDLQTETAILKGDSLALAVIQRLKLASQPQFAAKGGDARKLSSERGLALEEAPQTRTRLLKLFRAHLSVQPVRGTRLIEATYEGHDPKQAAQIANALIDSYKSQYLQSHYDATTEASNWLTKQLSDLKTNVEDSEKRLTDFEKESGILSFQTSFGDDSKGGGGGEEIHSVVIEKLDALNAELTVAEANRIEKEAIYRLAHTGSADVILGLGNDPLAAQSNSMVLTQGGGLSNLQQLRQQQSQLKVNLSDAAATYGANNRHLREIQTQIRALDEQIEEELQQIIKRAQVDFQLAQQTEGEIRRQFDQQQAAASKLNEKTVQFAVLSQEAFSRKKLYEDLYTKLQEANVSAGIKATNITIVDPARSQSIPVRPKPVTYIAMGMLLGIFLGFATAFTADNFDRTVTTPLEVEETTGKPVIGIIPTFGEQARTYGAQLLMDKRKTATKELPISSPIWMLSQPNSPAAEAFRAMRTSIMLSRAGGCPRIILVTSCIPGEGKTTLTTNLAVAFAQHNKKVIIIEADMRRPRMKHVMDVPNGAGLSNVLSGTLSSDEAILQGVHVATLDILPAGPHPPMPSEILGSTAFDELLEQLRSRYDIVLIDSPPALLVTDAVAISAKTDAVLWVAQAGVVSRPQLALAAELIARNKMPLIGFAVNRMTRRVAGYGYGDGYGYYDSYYGEKQSHDA